MNEFHENIIDRYNALLSLIVNQRIVFMKGFDKLINNHLEGSYENIMQKLLNKENKNNYLKQNIDNIMPLFHLSTYCEIYFHNEYIQNNEVLKFVKNYLYF